ncbi:MAG: hypothetical protein KDC05_06725 [Bacteroidales bacterium]|nr:hypothetical protein [Bacteroidales bacterium]
METKKLFIRLRILLNDVIDFNKGAFFGIRALDPEVIRLWEEYNEIRNLLAQSYPLMFREFPQLECPDPYLATSNSFYYEGTMIYKPEHFATLRLELEKMLETLAMVGKRESA